MLKPGKKEPRQNLFFSLEDSLNQKHPLYILANKVAWDMFETSFRPLYCQDNGTPAKPIRLMVGLLILKHVRNVSDESIVEQWSENLYYQYFCGQRDFVPVYPCASSEPVHFRRRAAVEPTIGHVKSDHRLGGNFYKGITGDSINVMLAAAAYNFKRMINKWKSSFDLFFRVISCSLFRLKLPFVVDLWAF
ncbi:hypothetical protein FACS1894169_01880 [Bacteroidia bacterium]|nr:hypothetical protein FACS1894169_01880 [Bacteroidia bacterium]